MTLCTLFSVLCTLFSVLSFTSCTSEDEAPSYDPITLTTPHIELGEVATGTLSRAVIGADGAVDFGFFQLYMLDANGNQQGETRGKYEYQEEKWKTIDMPVVQNGPGQYYAGITAWVVFKETETMPAIGFACYGYRGYVTVDEDGTFTPGAPLTPMTAAVQVKLKDANGAEITDETGLYQCSYDGLYAIVDFRDDADGHQYPMGKNDPIIESYRDDELWPSSYAYGGLTPGTYPAELANENEYGRGVLSSVTPTAPWKLFTIHHSPDGFEWSSDAQNYVPKGELFTWAVNYPAKTLTLEAGKLYTFTVTLGGDRVITLSPDAVSISEWQTGETINIGK